MHDHSSVSPFHIRAAFHTSLFSPLNFKNTLWKTSFWTYAAFQQPLLGAEFR
jgi:hypothetical protein